MQVLDAVARLTHKNTDEKVMLCLAGLCHDLGKTTSTTPEFSCRGHECTGVPLAKQFLKRLTNNTKLIASVKKLVLYHLMPRLLIEQKSTSTAFKRLAIKLAPEISLRQLGIISLADQQGRNGENQNPLTTWLESFNKFTQIIKTFGIEEKPEPPILQGKDLIDYCNPGPALGKLLKKAYEIQITEVIHDPKILKDRVTKK
jgi:tRNA nucleotidyltransferase (CCA-adding enzyme)